MLHIVGILTDHIATSQLDTIKSQMPGYYLILKCRGTEKPIMVIPVVERGLISLKIVAIPITNSIVSFETVAFWFKIFNNQME